MQRPNHFYDRLLFFFSLSSKVGGSDRKKSSVTQPRTDLTKSFFTYKYKFEGCLVECKVITCSLLAPWHPEGRQRSQANSSLNFLLEESSSSSQFRKCLASKPVYSFCFFSCSWGSNPSSLLVSV